ncbi:unnamed protein product (macronuclear) [Paramecium tetraurelia]|uniref:Uncharacterized protein n=1 Tax=Paramecium tetraurelia TaxID=5888 RepID=A0EE52_PARTE|nr:uncharacterized protein GSPATT00025913001 [Paramecium tetraurelia]CAK93569.1 unnamed protein product [Paramecium tetraurelia]|eukprot:XP_001460966.1 hypothetical protein (macronuclear) [Paramecium tetraurelia strain d4-2]
MATDYRYSQIDNPTGAGKEYGELDLVKIAKLDKLLSKIDNDFKKKQKEITKPKLVEIMKTTHEIYQIVLYEISEMLESAKLSELRQSLNKIYNGQNMILNYILKLNTNFEVQADKMLETLQKNIGQPRRKSVDQSAQQSQETNKLANQMVQLQPIVKKTVRKTYADKGTDTGDDIKDARNQANLLKKEMELKGMQEELDQDSQQITEFLKNRKIDLQAVGESKAETNLKEVLKDLGKKKHEVNDAEDEAVQQFEELQKQQQNQLKSLEGAFVEGIQGMQKQAQEKALADIKAGKAIMKNGVLVYMQEISMQTDRTKMEQEYQDKLDKQRKENHEVQQKMIQLEKRIKDTLIERDAYAQQVGVLNGQVQKVTLEKKKLEEKQQEEKKAKDKQQQEQQAVLNKNDSEKIKRLVEDNIKMKLRIKNLLDNIAALEKEMNRNFERFKLFISNNPNLSEEQKKAILGQAENLFKVNLNEKLNVQEMKELMAVDDLLRDPIFKQICGSDIGAITRGVKKDEMTRKQKLAKVPFYDALFDPEFLNPDEKIVIRKVKKMVKRQKSDGEWVEEEMEVEEEVVVNAQGEELRKRDKPNQIQQSKQTQDFLEAHGGFAIGGSKINLPSKPVAKDGKEIKQGEWFEDKTGKKVRKLQGNDGDEERFEVEEEYVDENGQKQKRIKQVRIKKDKNGVEYVEEEYVMPDGKKLKVAKRTVKDKDGVDVVEEVTVDEKGNKITKRQKAYKDADGNEIIEEELIDEKGNKTKVKRKVYIDSDGNEVVVEERIDAKGNKVITTKRKNEYGQDIIEQQIIDKNGKVATKEQKIYQENGITVVEEVAFDAQGNKIIKKTRIKDGVEEVEIQNADGSVTIQRKVKNQDGTEAIEEEIVDVNGNITVVKKKVYRDAKGNVVTEEERIDAKTGQKVVIKTVKDSFGRETVQKQIQNKDGSIVNQEKNVQQDAEGNLIENEVVYENGQKLNVQRKIYKEGGAEVKEEVIVDEQGNKKVVKTKVTKGKDGAEITETVTTNADGSKTVVKQTVDKDGNIITEIETVDAQGNKIIVKKKKNKNGEEFIEETKVGADGKIEKSVKRVRADKNGNLIVEETTIAADGTRTTKIAKLGTDQKATQTEGTYNDGKMSMDQVLQYLYDLGLDKTKIEQIKNWVSLKQQIKTNKQQKLQQTQQQFIQQQEVQEEIPNQQQRPASAESQKSLDTLDDEEPEQDQADKLYNKMVNNKSGGMGELIRQVRNALGKQGNENISQEEFRDYMVKMKQVHAKCGDNCPHLKRFYEKLGFIQKKYKRRFLKMKDTRIEAKTKLPHLQNFSSIKQ